MPMKKKKTTTRKTIRKAPARKRGQSRTNKAAKKKRRNAKTRPSKSEKQRRIDATERLKPWQWKKGESGNVLGRPPGIGSVRGALRTKLSEPMVCIQKGCRGRGYIAHATEEPGQFVHRECHTCKGTGLHPSNMTFAQFIAEVLALQAASGNIRAVEDVMDHIDGRPKESVAMELDFKDDGTPVIDAGIIHALMKRAKGQKE